MFYIYTITNQINNKKYVGKSKNPWIRFTVHKSTAKGGPEIYGDKFQYIHKAMNKYGSENFILDIIEENDSEDFILNRERFWIKNFKENN